METTTGVGTGRLQEEWVHGDYRSGYRETIGVGTGRLQQWVQGDYSNGYRETIAMGTGRLQQWVQESYRSGYRETIGGVGRETTGVGTGRLQKWVQVDYRSGYRVTVGVICFTISFSAFIYSFDVFSLFHRLLKQYRIKNIWSPPGIKPKYFFILYCLKSL